DQFAAGRSQGSEGRIHALIVARGDEQAERSVVPQASVECKRRRDAPGIFRIETEAADALRKRAIVTTRLAGSGAVWKARIRSRRGRIRTSRQHTWIRDVKTRVAGIGIDRLDVAG